MIEDVLRYNLLNSMHSLVISIQTVYYKTLVGIADYSASTLFYLALYPPLVVVSSILLLGFILLTILMRTSSKLARIISFKTSEVKQSQKLLEVKESFFKKMTVDEKSSFDSFLMVSLEGWSLSKGAAKVSTDELQGTKTEQAV